MFAFERAVYVNPIELSLYPYREETGNFVIIPIGKFEKQSLPLSYGLLGIKDY